MPLATIDDLLSPDFLERLQDAQNLGSRYQKYLAKLEDSGPVRHPGIHASEISKCYRQAVYTMKGEEKRYEAERDTETKAYWAKVLNHGTSIHELLQKHFTGMAKDSERTLLFEDEIKLHPDIQPLAKKWNIHSSCDGLFTFVERDPRTWRKKVTLRLGLEIKSASDASFSKTREPKPEHIEQVHIYMKVLDIPVFWLLYFNKNDQSYTPPSPPWLVTFDERLWGKLEQRFASWNEHIANGTLPAAMPGMHCDFCGYQWTCKPKRSSYKPRLSTSR
jgi:CRISPR/Cas system-associated exonuclease Cas4 (RecB family)